jgi:hypothetical protein
MVERVNELNFCKSKLVVCLDLYDDLKRKKVSSHDDFIVTKSKLIFLRKEILEICDKMSEITKEREKIVKSGI